MIQLKRILCPVDLTDLSIRPLVNADAIARWYGGRVTVLHVVPTFEPMELRAGALFDPVQLVYPMPREQVLEQLREALNTAGLASDNMDIAAEAGEPAAVIVEQSVVTNSDVIVMASHGRSGLDRFLLGSVTEKVLRKAPCPVLTMPPHAGEAPTGVAVHRILCAMDFSPGAMQALGFATDLAARANASVTVLQVIEWLAEKDERAFAHFDVPEFRRRLMQDTQEQLETLVTQQPPVAGGYEAKVCAGRAYREILRVAAEDSADLIIMGAQGRGGPALTGLGSTTQQVVRAATCPVMTVRAPFDAR